MPDKPLLCFTEFNPDFIQKADTIVKKYWSGDFDPDPYQEGFIAVPNLFSFYFCADEGYNNLKPEVIYKTRFPYLSEDENEDNLDFDSSKIHCAIFFQCSNNVNVSLANLFETLLPNYIFEVDDGAFVVSPDENQHITLLEIMSLLTARGFIYDKENCDFKKFFKDLVVIKRPV